MSITGAGLPPGITGNETLTPGAYGPVCSRCPIFSQCLKVCDLIENVIPSMEKGRVDAEDLPRLYMGIRTVNVLLDNIHLLPPRQQQVVQLYYRESLQQQEIASLRAASSSAAAAEGPPGLEARPRVSRTAPSVTAEVSR